MAKCKSPTEYLLHAFPTLSAGKERSGSNGGGGHGGNGSTGQQRPETANHSGEVEKLRPPATVAVVAAATTAATIVTSLAISEGKLHNEANPNQHECFFV